MKKYFRCAVILCLGLLLANCDSGGSGSGGGGGNTPPTIDSGPAASPAIVNPGGTATIVVTARDAEGTALTYTWQVTGGAITSGDGTATIVWTAPAAITGTSELFTITVTVSDGIAEASASTQVEVLTTIPMPAHQRVVFQRGPDGSQQIWRIDADDTDSSTLVQLTNNGARNLLPALSADGTKVAYTSNLIDQDEIWIMNIDGSAPQRLTTLGGSAPNFSWDGTRIVFSSDRDGNPEIYSMAVDGSDQRRLTNDALRDEYPAYSPDGSTIAFCRGADYDNFQIFLMNADGSGLDQLSATLVGTGNWSPDFATSGNLIAFESDRDLGEEIWFMTPAGGDLTKTSVTPQENDPTFSMDDTMIAFYNWDGIWIMNYNATDGTTSNLRQLTFPLPGEDIFPSMGP